MFVSIITKVNLKSLQEAINVDLEDNSNHNVVDIKFLGQTDGLNHSVMIIYE